MLFSMPPIYSILQDSTPHSRRATVQPVIICIGLFHWWPIKGVLLNLWPNGPIIKQYIHSNDSKPDYVYWMIWSRLRGIGKASKKGSSIGYFDNGSLIFWVMSCGVKTAWCWRHSANPLDIDKIGDFIWPFMAEQIVIRNSYAWEGWNL